MPDIIERLREMRTLVEAAPIRYSMTAVGMCERAADEIQRLRHEVASACLDAIDIEDQRAENWRSLGDSGIKWMDRAKLAEADAARLAKALRAIDSMSVESDAAAVGRRSVGIARTALLGRVENV